MRYDHITTVYLFDLANKPDRRGIIARFELTEVPNMEYMAESVARLLRHTISLLASEYGNWQEVLFGEAQQCWVATDYKTVYITHKYWNDEQIEAFRSIIKALAKLHDWRLVCTQ